MMAAGEENAPESVEALENIPAETPRDAQAAFDAGGAVDADEMRVLFGAGEESPDAEQEADEVRVATPYTNTVAHPRDIASLIAEEDLPPAPPEFEGEEDAANALSASLDSMIGELLDVEIREPSEREDYIPPDESSFPPRSADAYRQKPPKADVGAVVLRLVTVVTFFVCGISIGLWMSYFLM
jgi:hypothetical protein